MSDVHHVSVSAITDAPLLETSSPISCHLLLIEQTFLNNRQSLCFSYATSCKLGQAYTFPSSLTHSDYHHLKSLHWKYVS